MPKKHLITGIDSDSIAAETGIETGDFLVGIDGEHINDVFDYRYLTSKESFILLVEKQNGDEWEIEVEKDADENLGLQFGSGLMDSAKSCANNCIFCFIDQLPKGMRETLYFKDDDSRLSFLTGNYVTLTNMSENELNKVLFYHLSPINISVHTTNEDLRCHMLNNKNAGRLKSYLNKIRAAGVEMNFQIVLCKGINDNDELDKTINDLSEFIPLAKSLSVVPAGLSEHRQGLFKLEPFEKKDAQSVLHQIHLWQKKLKKAYKTAFVYAADEFYLKAEAPLPNHRQYEGFPQLQNGVGMLSVFRNEAKNALKNIKTLRLDRRLSIATGTAAYGFIAELADMLTKKVDGLVIKVYAVSNRFFGRNITVSGLLTGSDILSALKGRELGDKLLIPSNALKSGEYVFLDNISLSDISKELATEVAAVDCNGYDFISNCLK